MQIGRRRRGGCLPLIVFFFVEKYISRVIAMGECQAPMCEEEVDVDGQRGCRLLGRARMPSGDK